MPTNLILQLPGGKRSMLSVSSTPELLAAASRLLGADAAVLRDGARLTAASPLPGSLATLMVEAAAPAAPAPPAPAPRAAAAPAPAPAPAAPPQQHAAHGDDVPECAICLERFVAAFPPVPAGACSHGFHETCLKTWRSQSAYCPLCRGPMFGGAPLAQQQPYHPQQQQQAYAPQQPYQPPQQQLMVQQQQQQQQQQPTTVVVVRSGGGAAAAGPPPSVEESLALLLRTRALLQASPEWRLLSGAVRSAAPLLGAACGAILRGIAVASPGFTGHVASALLAAGTFGRVINALAGGGGGGGGGGASVTCGQCRTVLGVPPGAQRFLCGQCGSVVALVR